MPPRYAPPSIEAILELPEDDPRYDLRGSDAGDSERSSTRRREQYRDTMSSPPRDTGDKARDKGRRSLRTAQGSVSRNATKAKPKNLSSRRGDATASRDEASAAGGRLRHRRTLSNRTIDSSSSSNDDDDHIEPVSRARLTSPSMASMLTTLTTATNNSGGSSGSNSTVTQASMSRLSVSKRPEPLPEVPMSPGRSSKCGLLCRLSFSCELTCALASVNHSVCHCYQVPIVCACTLSGLSIFLLHDITTSHSWLHDNVALCDQKSKTILLMFVKPFKIPSNNNT
jgi:hypothetical protein